MKRPVLTTFAVVAAIAVTWLYMFNTSTPTGSVAEAEAPVAGAKNDQVAAGFHVQIDPNTGRIVPPTDAPPTADYPKYLKDALSTSAEGLQEIEAPVGGGKMVSLQGRFQNTYAASVDENGGVKAACDLPQSVTEPSSDSEEE